MSAKKDEVVEFKEEKKVNLNPEKNNSQIIRYSKDFIKNLRFENIKKENDKQNEIEKKEKNNFFQKTDIEKIKQKLKENLDLNLNSYILSTKAKEQKILELLEIIDQYESQIASLNNQIMISTKSNKQMKEILKKIEFNYEKSKMDLIAEKEINKKNNIYMNNVYKEKNIWEKKIKELVNIINQYSSQIEALTETLNNLKQEFFEYKKENEQDKKELSELNNINNTLKKEKEEIKENYNILNENFIKLKKNQENLEKNFNALDNKYKVINNEKEKYEKYLEQEKNKNISLIDYINQDLKSLVDYFNAKFNSIILNQENINENNLALNCFQNMESNNEINKINFEMFIKSMIKGINSIKEKMNKEKEINQELINKEKKYIKEINELKEKMNINISNKSNSLMKLKEAQIENMNKLIKIKDDNIIKLKQDIKRLVEDNIKLMKELEKNI